MDDLSLLATLLATARAAGADAADALLTNSLALGVQCRLGRTEHVERAESRELGLRVFVGQRQALVSASAIEPRRFADLAEQAVAMARLLPEDPFAGLAGAVGTVTQAEALELDDAAEPATEALAARAVAAEEAARAIEGITNSEGAEASYSRTELALATSEGFAGRFARTRHTLSVSVLAGTGTNMQRDSDFTSSVQLADLEPPETVGRRAAERAVARLNPIRPQTMAVPVVFDPQVAGGLLGHLAMAANGAAVARGTSFLRDRLGERVFSPSVTIIDDPRRRRGLRSRPFDGEGLPTAALTLVEEGVLASWLLDARSARQLGQRSTAHASRGTESPPSPAPSNLYLQPGPLSPAELMADIGRGLYVTELIGMGVNPVTGDYSRGASGFMIRDGALAEPVAECTIAGTLAAMFASLLPASDLVFRRGIDAPTVRVEGMTVAGT
jgi:PmbA protein